MKLANAVTIGDLREMARRAVPEFVFKPMDNGNGDGEGPLRNARAFDRYLFNSRVLQDVEQRSQSVELFGRAYSSPFGISAVGVAGNYRRGAERMLAAAAAGANIPFMLSGVSMDPIEEIARIAPGLVWQQLYATRDEAVGDDIARRARDAGVDVLVYTVDTPIAPRINWLERAGIRYPVRVPLGTWPYVLLEAGKHPAWAWDQIRHGGLPSAESFRPYAPAGARAADISAAVGRQIPAIKNWDEVERLRKLWPGELVLKGITRLEDAHRALSLGVDAITVSNHGGNKMEAMGASIDYLPRIVNRQGGIATALFDGGIRKGSDILVALALGAQFCFVGRATLYGVLAGGEAGAAKAIEILRLEIDRALAQIGCADLTGIDAGYLEPDGLEAVR